jgi:hypothetical protein
MSEAEKLYHEYGERCGLYCPGCGTCEAYKFYDEHKRLVTDEELMAILATAPDLPDQLDYEQPWPEGTVMNPQSKSEIAKSLGIPTTKVSLSPCNPDDVKGFPDLNI